MPFIKNFFYRFNDRGPHLMTVEVWEQPNYFSCAARRRTVQEEFRLRKTNFITGLMFVFAFCVVSVHGD